MVWFVAAALAAPPPFDQVDQVDSYHGCIIRMGRPDAGGVQPLRAECHWTDVSVARLREVLVRYERSGDFIDCMKEASIVRTEAARALVWQLDHLGWGLANRESQTWMHASDIAGGCQIAWSKAEEPFTVREGNVVMPFNEGSWWVTAAADGGVDVVQDLKVDPGGSVPTWVVNWFQTYGLSDELKRLHALTLGA
jgi:hypothetical protein